LLQRGRGQLHRIRDDLLQARYPLPHVLDLMQAILACELLSYLRETQLRDPDQLGACLLPDSGLCTLTGAQKEPAQAMPPSRLILHGCNLGASEYMSCIQDIYSGFVTTANDRFILIRHVGDALVRALHETNTLIF